MGHRHTATAPINNITPTIIHPYRIVRISSLGKRIPVWTWGKGKSTHRSVAGVRQVGNSGRHRVSQPPKSTTRPNLIIESLRYYPNLVPSTNPKYQSSTYLLYLVQKCRKLTSSQLQKAHARSRAYGPWNRAVMWRYSRLSQGFRAALETLELLRTVIINFKAAISRPRGFSDVVNHKYHTNYGAEWDFSGFRYLNPECQRN